MSSYQCFFRKKLLLDIQLSISTYIHGGCSVMVFSLTWVCLWYICCLHSLTLANFVKSSPSVLPNNYHINIFFLTETWLTSLTKLAELFDCTPGFTILHSPNPNFSKSTGVSGCGAAFLVCEPYTILSSPSYAFKSFENLSFTLEIY